MKRSVALLLITIVAVFMFLGCGKRKYNEEEIAEAIKAGLREKYDKEFIIQSVNEYDRGTNFADRYYSAKCTDELGIGPFYASIERDGTCLKDNYEGYLYKQEIDAALRRLLSQVDLIAYSEYESAYDWTASKSESYQQYVEGGNVTLIAKISVIADDKEEAEKAVYKLIDLLQNNRYGFSLAVEWGDNTITFVWDVKDEELTMNDVKRRLEM